MNKKKIKAKQNKEKGSALILVLIGVVILSLLGVASLNQSTTDMVISRNFAADKTTFFLADSGISRGIHDIRLTIDPVSVLFDVQKGENRIRTGPLKDDYGYPITTAQSVQGFLGGFEPPIPPGGSPEENIGYEVYDWDLTISAFVSGFTKGINQKEIQVVIVSVSPEY